MIVTCSKRHYDAQPFSKLAHAAKTVFCIHSRKRICKAAFCLLPYTRATDDTCLSGITASDRTTVIVLDSFDNMCYVHEACCMFADLLGRKC